MIQAATEGLWWGRPYLHGCPSGLEDSLNLPVLPGGETLSPARPRVLRGLTQASEELVFGKPVPFILFKKTEDLCYILCFRNQ